MSEQHQNLAIIGHVDHGKSTLVGRLLYETGSVPEHVIEQHREEAEEKGKGGFEFAYVMDNLAEEREAWCHHRHRPPGVLDGRLRLHHRRLSWPP